MMKVAFIISLLISFCGCTALAENNEFSHFFDEKFLAEKVVLLNLKYKLDDTVVKEIKFHGNRIDPNRTSIRDRFSISINDEFVKLPKSIYSRLHKLRRSFAYDGLSGGILKKPDADWICAMGGPAEGFVLEALYLTLSPKTFRIEKSEMKPVYGLALNCLFNEFYTPLESYAREDARAVIEILNTIDLIYGKKTVVDLSMFKKYFSSQQNISGVKSVK